MQSGLTPLHVASFMGCMNIVIFLLQQGANANAPTMRGEAPLHLASRANQTDIVRILLRNNAEVDARARLTTTLYFFTPWGILLEPDRSWDEGRGRGFFMILRDSSGVGYSIVDLN